MFKSQLVGFGMIVFSLTVGIFYLWMVFFSPETLSYFGMSLRWWALVMPLLVIVLGSLGLIAWVGYSIVRTPPATPPIIEKTHNDNDKK